MIEFKKKVYPLDDEDYLIDNDLMVKLALKENGVYMPLGEIFKGIMSGSIEELDAYVVDNWQDVIDYTFKTNFGAYNIPLTIDVDFDSWDIKYYGVRVKKINNSYQLTWGYQIDKFVEFKQGGDYDIFDSLECDLNEYIIDKMKESFKKLVNFNEITVKI